MSRDPRRRASSTQVPHNFDLFATHLRKPAAHPMMRWQHRAMIGTLQVPLQIRHSNAFTKQLTKSKFYWSLSNALCTPSSLVSITHFRLAPSPTHRAGLQRVGCLPPACSSLELCPSPARCDTLPWAPSCPGVW